MQHGFLGDTTISQFHMDYYRDKVHIFLYSSDKYKLIANLLKVEA